MTIEEARAIMDRNFIGPDELMTLPAPFAFGSLTASEIPFSLDALKEHAGTHILVFTPHVDGMTINWFREQFDMDPAREPCMYNQDWYVKESFASKTSLDGAWHLIQKDVREDTRAKRPEDIETMLRDEQFPTAITCTFTFFVWWLLREGEILWKHDFLWCSDRDHNGDRIYVGRYEDPERINKNGFNIHRHLALRPAYSAAPEVVA